MKVPLIVLLFLAFLLVAESVTDKNFLSTLPRADPTKYKAYLAQNKLPQCTARPEQPPMIKSYYATSAYFDGISKDQRVSPDHTYTQPELVPACNHLMIQPDALNAYEFETERWITMLGLNIYDGAIYSMAMSLLGESDSVLAYEQQIIQKGATCQFGSVRAVAPCKGVIVEGRCNDTEQAGACGFCYGDGSNSDATLPKANAWTFSEITDYWAIQGTVDSRCPALNHLWTWNTYKPVLGENAWANLIGPLQVAFIKYGSATAIPDNDISIQMAIDFLPSLSVMFLPNVGGVYYAPHNTIVYLGHDEGFQVSTENNVSLLGGLRALKEILTKKNIHMDKMDQINNLISNILNYVKSSYDTQNGYFRQGGTIDPNTKTFTWNSGKSDFAVDCQTWTISVIGPQQIDAWFGPQSTVSIWDTTKKLGGYHYSSGTNSVDGLGFSFNSDDQVISGEWTLGAVNMLRILAAEYNNQTFTNEANALRLSVGSYLQDIATINNVQVTGIKYSNKRYWIPFGWWANPLLSTASTGWAVLIDSNFNPLHLGGAYSTQY